MTEPAKKDLSPITTKMQAIYRNGRMMFLPHHVNETFVGPGYGRQNMREYTQMQLVGLGAELGYYPLWPRNDSK